MIIIIILTQRSVIMILFFFCFFFVFFPLKSTVLPLLKYPYDHYYMYPVPTTMERTRISYNLEMQGCYLSTPPRHIFVEGPRTGYHSLRPSHAMNSVNDVSFFSFVCFVLPSLSLPLSPSLSVRLSQARARFDPFSSNPCKQTRPGETREKGEDCIGRVMCNFLVPRPERCLLACFLACLLDCLLDCLLVLH
ncbi:hypothetical protein GGS21DRAFT_515587 [Xylaria nigripes]|nr:hypothetical protein GGS21DRAFT_515587 [Xylaria nigripes]